MSNNYWNQQPDNMNGNQQNGHPRSGNLLRNYSEQTVQAPPQYAPPPVQAPPGAPPYSLLPPVYTPPQQAWPAPQGWPTPSFFNNAMQTVRKLSGKIVAARSGNVDQEPLVLYRPTTPPEMPPGSKPWKRSHSVRVAMQMRHRRERWKQGHPTGRRIWTIVLTIFTLLVVIAISSGAASGYAYYQSQLPRLQGLANQQVEQSTRIYDRNDQLLYTVYDNATGRGTPVTYNYVPGVMQDAMTAAEDHTFWDNSGIDPQGILRAATEYTSSGSVQSGGSTITQQVIKNLIENQTHDTPQVTLQRKIPEAALAIGLTQQYPKSKILEMYLNISPFGAQELGVDAAAEDYFGLRAKCDANFKCIPAIASLDRDLTKCKNPNDDSTCRENPLLGLARASLLAGMPQSPVSYDPLLGSDHKALALARQDYVLQQMLVLNKHINTALGDQVDDMGAITPEIIQQVEAMTAKMTFVGFRNVKRAPHFVDWVSIQLESALGNGDESLGVHLFLSGGFNIRTTIDADLETYVEKAVQRHLDQPEFQYFLSTYPYGPLNKYHNVNDSAVVVMNAKDGEILAMDGSANYNNVKDKTVAGQYNAALSPRQPGSSFKPIVYATAFQMGWYPGIVLPDKKTYFPNSTPDPNCGNINTTAYCPYDYGGTYNNKNWNIQLDIANSFNIPAVKTLMFAGYNNVVNMAERMGITGIDLKNLGPSFALGTTGVSLLQMVEAYQVFANQGARVLPQSILDIWDNYGHNLYHFDPTHPKSVQVLSKQIAYLITSILTDEQARSYEFENDHVLSMWDWTLTDGSNPQVAAKTGTTDSFKDNWTLGYTPNVVVGVWSGNADDEPMDQHVVGITGAAPIWHDVIERVSGHCNQDDIPCGNIHTIFPPKPFQVPPGITTQEVNTVNGLAGNGYASLMLDSDVPQQSGLTTNNGNGTPTPTPTP